MRFRDSGTGSVIGCTAATSIRCALSPARLLGYYAAKPLYGKLDARGRIDRSAGFDGGIIALFVPSPARSWKRARLVHARMPRDRIIGADGRRNWPAIRRTAEAAIRRATN